MIVTGSRFVALPAILGVSTYPSMICTTENTAVGHRIAQSHQRSLRASSPRRSTTSDDGTEGLARELARIGLPVSTYTQWYWKIDLHNLMHFLKLRLDPHAQYEIRAYGEVIAGIVAKWVPLSYEAFEDYIVGAARVSRMEIVAIRALARGEQPDLNALGMSKREQREFGARFLEPK